MSALRWWNVGFLMPRLLAVALAIDVLFRLVPPAWLGFRPGIAEFFYRAPGEAFVPNSRSHSDRDYGDLAALGNLPELRLYRPVTFTSDSLGFRNVQSSTDVRAVLVGDSFGLGEGVTDEDTLSAQLSRVAGCRVYNAASQVPLIQVPRPDVIFHLTRQLRMGRGLIIAERVERLASPKMPPPEARRAQFARSIPGVSFVQRAQAHVRVSPVTLWAGALYKRFQNDLILPNEYMKLVTKRSLQNGDWMLFYQDELAGYERQRGASIDYWTRLNRELNQAGFGLLVVLVPNKYTVYYSSLVDPVRTAVPPEQFLQETEAALREARVPVINLTGPFQRQAQKDLARKSYLYFRDDSHWNSRGIEIAASEIRDAWRSEGKDPCQWHPG